MTILISAILAVGLPLLILFLANLLGAITNLDSEKGSPFECGFDPNKDARLPFSIRFFLLALIFLIFDVEIRLLFPLLIKILLRFSALRLFSGSIFFFVLLAGTLHEWREGKLDWYALILFY